MDKERLRKEIGSMSPGEICDIITDLILSVEEIENKEINGVKFSKIKSMGGFNQSVSCVVQSQGNMLKLFDKLVDKVTACQCAKGMQDEK
jgi:hypothetical protein